MILTLYHRWAPNQLANGSIGTTQREISDRRLERPEGWVVVRAGNLTSVGSGGLVEVGAFRHSMNGVLLSASSCV